MIFPNWGALSANIINVRNRKSNHVGLIGGYIPTKKPTKKDWLIAILLMAIPTIIIWLVFILIITFNI